MISNATWPLSLGTVQHVPSGPVTLVVPFAAGGPTDAFARVLAQSWGKALGTQVIVENKSGAGTALGMSFVAKARPDGQTILMSTAAHAVLPSLNSKLQFDPTRSFAPIGLAAKAPLALIAGKSFPADDLKGFIAYVKANPGKISYGSAGVGTATHVSAELINSMAGLKTTHVPYRGNSPAAGDLMGGHIGYVIDSAPSAVAMAKAGTGKILATTMAQRSKQLPNVPTIAEEIPGYDAYTWNAFFAPAGTPPATLAKLSTTLKLALADQALRAQAEDMGLILENDPSPIFLEAFLKTEIVKWAAVIKNANIPVQ